VPAQQHQQHRLLIPADAIAAFFAGENMDQVLAATKK